MKHIHSIESIEKNYDLVIVGGGVTGAGVFHEALVKGLSPLLVEANDFAWGTSSRSSKMVHGGLRYLKEGKILLTRAAVRERQRLLSEYPGLVEPLNFIMPLYQGHGPSMGAMKFGLSLYSLMAGERQHEIYSRTQVIGMVPRACQTDLISGVGFKDAQVDDARLVLRLIFDGCDHGGHALNYTRATAIERNTRRDVIGVHLRDTETGDIAFVKTPVVINATGAFAEALHPSPVKGFHIRPLRGSHLVFPGKLYPLDRVISFIHPTDNRAVFLFPWEGCLLLGTTDVDHTGVNHAGAHHTESMSKEPCISREEADYLMAGLAHILPDLKVSLEDCIASIAGVRPILSKKKVAASKESREHVVWKDHGLVTVTGGKLTTFRLLATDALKAAQKYLPWVSKRKTRPGAMSGPASKNPIEFREEGSKDSQLSLNHLSTAVIQRLGGRYGARVKQMVATGVEKDFLPIGNTQTLWAELCHGARHEQIRHLSDLLLRRVRIGLFLPNGGMDFMDEIQTRVAPFLDWDGERWAREIKAYEQVWQDAYSVPGRKNNKD